MTVKPLDTRFKRLDTTTVKLYYVCMKTSEYPWYVPVIGPFPTKSQAHRGLEQYAEGLGNMVVEHDEDRVPVAISPHRKLRVAGMQARLMSKVRNDAMKRLEAEDLAALDGKVPARVKKQMAKEMDGRRRVRSAR